MTVSYVSPDRLLIVEDVQNIADIICHAATDAGFDARSANGLTAMGLYDSFSPMVIVLDLLLAGMEDYEFLEFLKTRHSKSRIIILSGSSDAYRKKAEDLARAGGLIIENNITKPFRINEIRKIFVRIKESMDAVRKIA